MEKAKQRRPKQKPLTQEQIDFRNSILRGKVRQIEKVEPKLSRHADIHLDRDDQIKKVFFYLNNCIFWINNFIDGESGEDRLFETAEALEKHGKHLQTLLKK